VKSQVETSYILPALEDKENDIAVVDKIQVSEGS